METHYSFARFGHTTLSGLFWLVSVLTTLTANAQSTELFTVVTTDESKLKLSDKQQEVLDKTKKSKTLKRIDYVQVGNLSKLLKKGELAFTLPGVGRLVAKTTQLEVINETNYKWTGEINSNDQFGYVYLYSQNGDVSGYISVENQSFHIKSLGKGLAALAETDMTRMKGVFCKSVGDGKPEKTVPPPNKGARVDPCFQSQRVRVLVVFTQAALAAVALPDLENRVRVSIDQFNQACSVSGVQNQRAQLELVGIEQTTWQETAGMNSTDQNAIDEIDRLIGVVRPRREDPQIRADIVVCLTDANYGGSLGFVRGNAAINLQNGDFAYATVEVDRIPDQPVFPHEIGHLFGGRHNDDPTPGDMHGYTYTIPFGFLNLGRKDFGTLMCPGLPAEIRRANRWSTPNQSHNGTATGTSASHNVARTIDASANRFADFLPPTNILSATIFGVGYPDCNTAQTYEAMVSCGNGPYAYQWERSDDGFTYYFVSNAEFYSTYFANPGGVQFTYLRLQVNSADGQTATSFLTIQSGGGCNGSPYRIGVEEKQTELHPFGITNVYPNPAKDECTTLLTMPESEVVTVLLRRADGQTVKPIFNGSLPAGKHVFNTSLAGLSTGVYVVEAQTRTRRTGSKIVIAN